MPITRFAAHAVFVAGATGLICPSIATAQITTATPTQYQPITLDLAGPATSELAGRTLPGGSTATANPFLDYRLDVTFSHTDGTSYVVPGYYAVDNAGGANDTWRTRFTPDRAGQWTYTVDFRTGVDVAISATPGSFATTGPHGASSNFNVAPVDVAAPGFLSKGRLSYAGGHYLQFANGDYFIKGGTDSPENLLGYAGFDNTTSGNRRGPDYDPGADDSTLPSTDYLHRYPTHIADWNTGDPTWTSDNPIADTTTDVAGQHGKSLIGALNYLSSQHVNSVYFLPNNIGGDGQDTHPYASTALDLGGNASNDNLHFDLSKLDQWETVFSHAQREGIHLHVVLNEAEAANKQELDNAGLGTERRLFYREMVARFGHHNALQWNLSEEYDYVLPLSSDTVKGFAKAITDIDPYDHPITVHQQGNARNAWAPFLGDTRFDLTSLQYAGKEDGLGAEVEYFRFASRNAGRPIPVMIDEPESIDDVGGLDNVRKRMLWDVLLSGGSVEWFHDNQDQSLENFRDFEQVWEDTWHARKFMQENLPFWEMDSIILTGGGAGYISADTLIRGEMTTFDGAEVFFKDGEVYAIYFPDGSNNVNPFNGNGAPELDLRDHVGLEFEASWYNPRSGLFEGSPFTLLGGNWASVGSTPSGLGDSSDWTLLVTLVPEPTSLATLGLFGALTLGRRRGG